MKSLIINTKDLTDNINIIKNICSDSKIIAVLKGNGYGLGITQFAQVLLENGIDFFAVSELEEAKTLRSAGFSNDILLLSPPSNVEEASEISKLCIIAAIGSLHSAKLFEGMEVRVHIKIDTGFGRFGFSVDEMDKATTELKKMENISFEGAFSHFSNSFGRGDTSKHQFDLFKKSADNLLKAGIDVKHKHICNSCGALTLPYARMDAVRIGSAFLGRLPIINSYGLKKIAYLSCKISDIKTLPKGHNIGYANTFRLKRNTTIAVVPIGYKDGFGVEKSRDTFRAIDLLRYIYSDMKTLGKKLYVKVNGKNAQILGRISMYNIIIDITDLNAKIGDEVLLECNPILIESTLCRKYVAN